MWTIEYDNETIGDDDGFAEWWTVTNGERFFESRDKADAEWLCALLNAQEGN